MARQALTFSMKVRRRLCRDNTDSRFRRRPLPEYKDGRCRGSLERSGNPRNACPRLRGLRTYAQLSRNFSGLRVR